MTDDARDTPPQLRAAASFNAGMRCAKSLYYCVSDRMAVDKAQSSPDTAACVPCLTVDVLGSHMQMAIRGPHAHV